MPIERIAQKPLAVILTEQFDRHGNQAKVAQILGVTQPTISRWLRECGLKTELRTVVVPIEKAS